MIIARRALLRGLLATPAIVVANNLMPIALPKVPLISEHAYWFKPGPIGPSPLGGNYLVFPSAEIALPMARVNVGDLVYVKDLSRWHPNMVDGRDGYVAVNGQGWFERDIARIRWVHSRGCDCHTQIGLEVAS